MKNPVKNAGALPPGKAVALEPLLSVVTGSVVSRTLAKHPTGSVTLFAFDKGQALSEHTAPFDAFITLLSGTAEITVSGKPALVHSEETLFMPTGSPHSLKAVKAFKMVLVMIKA